MLFRSLINKVFLVGAAVTLTTLATVASASAAPTSAGTHCAAKALPAGSTAHAQVHCFSTFAESIAFATAGRVHLSNAANSRSVSAAELNQASPAANYVLSIDYMNAGFSGATFTWYQSSPCGNYQASSMPSGWNDVISSVAAYSGCATTLYWNTGFGQPTYLIGVDGSASSLGSFNDQTSSQKWCSRYPCG